VAGVTADRRSRCFRDTRCAPGVAGHRQTSVKLDDRAIAVRYRISVAMAHAICGRRWLRSRRPVFLSRDVRYFRV